MIHFFGLLSAHVFPSRLATMKGYGSGPRHWVERDEHSGKEPACLGRKGGVEPAWSHPILVLWDMKCLYYSRLFKLDIFVPCSILTDSGAYCARRGLLMGDLECDCLASLTCWVYLRWVACQFLWQEHSPVVSLGKWDLPCDEDFSNVLLWEGGACRCQQESHTWLNAKAREPQSPRWWNQSRSVQDHWNVTTAFCRNLPVSWMQAQECSKINRMLDCKQLIVWALLS